MHQEEQNLRQRGFSLIAGIDEAGRGPLAGPVVAAAIVLPADYRNPGVRDSKKLTASQREALFVELQDAAVAYGIGILGPKAIDQKGILNATKLAMRQAVRKLQPAPDFILIDAVSINLDGVPQKAILHGDDLVFCIAAASILAKVTRDRLMLGYHQKYPEYGFDQHMGYPTDQHRNSLRLHGPSPIHRMTFGPLKALNI